MGAARTKKQMVERMVVEFGKCFDNDEGPADGADCADGAGGEYFVGLEESSSLSLVPLPWHADWHVADQDHVGTESIGADGHVGVDAGCADGADGVDGADGANADGVDAGPADRANSVGASCMVIVESTFPKLHIKWAKMAKKSSRETRRKATTKLWQSTKKALEETIPFAMAEAWTLGMLKQKVYGQQRIGQGGVIGQDRAKFHHIFSKLVPQVLKSLKSKRGRPRKTQPPIRLAPSSSEWRETMAMFKEDGMVGKLLARKFV